MPDQTYFVKIRGRVLGPFLPNRLTEMVRQGKLSRIHMLSSDGEHWQKANEFPDLFQAAAQLSAQPAKNNTDSSAIAADTPQQPTVQEQDLSGWHYGLNGESYGPVPKSKIIELIDTRQLSESDLIWCDGMQEWSGAGTVPQFMDFFQRQNSSGGSTNVDTGTNRSQNDLSTTAKAVGSHSSWVFFICANTYLIAAVYFFTFIAGLVRGGKQSDPALITVGLIALVYTGMFALIAYYFQMYSSTSRRFAVSKKLSDLNESLNWLRRAWQLIGIMLIILWVFVLISVIYSFTLTQALL